MGSSIVNDIVELAIDSASGVGGLWEWWVRGISSFSAPISSARSTTALLEEPSSSWSPRVKYAVVASIITNPITRLRLAISIGSVGWEILQNTPVILPISTPLTEGLSGKRTVDVSTNIRHAKPRMDHITDQKMVKRRH